MDQRSATQIRETKIRQVRPQGVDTPDRYYNQQLTPDLRLAYCWDHSSVPHWSANLEVATPAEFPGSYEGWLPLFAFDSWADTRKGLQEAAASCFLLADGEGITLARVCTMLERSLDRARTALALEVECNPEDDGTAYLSPVKGYRARIEWLTQRIAYTREREGAGVAA